MKHYLKTVCLLLSLCLSFVLGSCSDDPEPDTDIALISGSDFTSGPKTVAGGTDLAAKVTARTLSEGASLTRFRILVTYYPNPAEELVFLDSVINSSTFNYLLRFQARRVAGSENYRFEVTDSNGKVKSTGFRITTTGNNFDYYSYSAKLFQPSDSISKSYLSAWGGVVYNETAVESEAFQKLVDMVYFFADGDSAVLASPSDHAADSVKLLGLPNWQIRNQTQFKSVSPAVFSNANTASLVTNAYSNATSTAVTVIPNLQRDTYYAFKIASGKQGILKVTEVKNEAKENSVSVDIKLQK